MMNKQQLAIKGNKVLQYNSCKSYVNDDKMNKEMVE